MGRMSIFQFLWDLLAFFVLCVTTTLESIFRWLFPLPLKSLQRDIILITGAANGLGKEICTQLVDGVSIPTLVCWDIEESDNNDLVRDLRRHGVNAFGYTVDIGDRGAVEIAAAKVKRDVGQVTLVIMNAGIAPNHQFLSHNPREISRAFEVNVLGGFWVIREFLPHMIETRSGHVVAISSEPLFAGCKNLVPYSSTMAAVTGYMDALRQEVKSYPTQPDIRFTTAFPGIPNNNGSKSAKRSFKIIAHRIINGIRRNNEYVYASTFYGWLAFFYKSQQSKIKTALAHLVEEYLTEEKSFK